MALATATSVDHARELVADAASPVVVVPVYNAHDDVLRCFESLLAHSPPSTTILVVDDHGDERRALERVAAAAAACDHDVVMFHRPVNGGFVAACNDAFDIAAGRDVVLVNSDIVVGAEWLERLTAAAASSNTVATASTVTNHGTILSLPDRNLSTPRLPAGMTPETAAKAVAGASLRLRPTIPTAVGHCVYIRRAALNAIGGFDTAFARGYGEEVDFSQRAIKAGFKHICADDVFTFHRGNGSFGDEAAAIQTENGRLINARYPWYAGAVERAKNDEHSPLARAIECGRRALLGQTIGVDAMCIGWFWSGTQTVAYETVVELAKRHPPGRVIAFVSPSLPPAIRDRFVRAGAVLETVEDITTYVGTPVDVIYRPYQVSRPAELKFLRSHGSRVVVNQLDAIAWSNPSYFANGIEWTDYRELTRLVLATVDGVAFISEHGRAAVAGEGLLAPGTPTEVVYCGATAEAVDPAPPVAPAGWTDDDRPVILTIGTSYHHKNRGFAVALVGRLADAGVDARLVLAGATPPHGSSLGTEAGLLLSDARLRGHVTELGELSDAEKRWLYQRATLVLYPTCSEGFGLVPFEAAAFGTPTLATRQGSLDEVLPAGIPTIDDLDLDRAVDQTVTLLRDESARADMCAAILAHGERFTWSATVDAVEALFDTVLRAPRNRVAATWDETGEHPWRLDGESHKSVRARRRQLERYVTDLQRMERTRHLLVPDGSRRQQLLRSGVNWARLKAQVFDSRRS